MPQLAISDIRRELLRTAGDYDAAGSRATALTGTLFHEVLAGLMGPDAWQAALKPSQLAAYAYDKLLGPRLTEMQASLRESGAETIHLWEALQAACQWICRLHAAAEQVCQPELELRWEVKEPHWTAPVMVFGVADALWKNPESGRWCVLEYKLGTPRPEADLAQACLYHSALCASGLSSGDGALAVISFGPELKERFYQGRDLAEAQAALRALIGRMAGVLPDTPTAAPSPAFASEAHHALGKKLVHALKEYGVPVEWNGRAKSPPVPRSYVISSFPDARPS